MTGDGRGLRASGPGEDRSPSPGRVAVVLVLSTVAVVAGGLAGPWDPPLVEESQRDRRSDGEPAPPLPMPTRPAVFDEIEARDVEPLDLSWLLGGFAALLGAGAVYLLLQWLRRRPRRRAEEPADPGDVAPAATVGGPPGPAPNLPALRAGLRGAGAHLRTHARPADAVLAAWVALEDAAARSGVARHPASTPTEFTVAVLDRTRADRAATRTLLTLYLRARFSEEPVSPDDVAAATAAVAQLTTDLAGDPAEDPAIHPPDAGPQEPPTRDGRP